MTQAAGSPIQSSGINPQEIIRIGRDVFTRPNYLMGTIKTSTATTRSLMMNILLPISVLMMVMGTVVWMSIGGGVTSSILYSVVSSAIFLAIAILSSKALSSPVVQGILGSSYTEANVLELYSIVAVPMLVGQILNMILPMAAAGIVGLAFLVFSFYLFFIGARDGLSCTKPVMFILAMIVVNFVLMIIAGSLQAAIMGQPVTDMAMAAKATGLTDEQAKAMADFQKLAESMEVKGN